MKKAKVVFFRAADKKWRWSLVAANGRRLCTPGESFSSRRKAEQNFYLVEKILGLSRGADMVFKP